MAFQRNSYSCIPECANRRVRPDADEEGAMGDEVRIEEESHLANTIVHIDETISHDAESLNRSKERSAGNKEADAEVRRVKTLDQANMKEVRDNPYFGRVDFCPGPSQGNTDVYYFGKFHLPERLSSNCPEQLVIGFGAPVCQLFYHPSPDGYLAPIGKITGTVKLKRRLKIANAKLLQIIDEIPPSSPGTNPPDSSLTATLAQPKGQTMKDIIPTIRPEQYDAIAAALQQVVFIKGVAGSGKSEIAASQSGLLTIASQPTWFKNLSRPSSFFRAE